MKECLSSVNNSGALGLCEKTGDARMEGRATGQTSQRSLVGYSRMHAMRMGWGRDKL